MDDERPRDPASLVRFMAAIDAYKDKAVYSSAARDDAPEDDDEGDLKAVVVAWTPGERVRLIGGEPGEWGFVSAVVCRESGCLYQVAWPQTKGTTDHWGFELEGAD